MLPLPSKFVLEVLILFGGAGLSTGARHYIEEVRACLVCKGNRPVLPSIASRPTPAVTDLSAQFLGEVGRLHKLVFDVEVQTFFRFDF
ncbi:hypothetical protein D3C80_1637710 [compost metagenome]